MNTSAWGITPGYWLWGTPIRILVVIDGIIDLTKRDAAFGLGYVLETLRAPASWCASFKVDVAKRDGPLEAGEGYTAYSHFKFTDSGFRLETYDQVWFLPSPVRLSICNCQSRSTPSGSWPRSCSVRIRAIRR